MELMHQDDEHLNSNSILGGLGGLRVKGVG